MAIKALFPSGKNSITVSGLYQWDYGQVLEIESADIGSEIVEVHFACTNMTEAVVRPCTFANGVGTVTIPDSCLEQHTTINAWIYRIEGTQGHTVATIILPVTARPRPSIAREIPTEISNRYTELITEVNEAVDALENGNVTVKQAQNASTSDSARTAGNSSTANYATNAGSANTAKKAEQTPLGKSLELALFTNVGGYIEYKRSTHEADLSPVQDGIVLFRLKDSNRSFDVRIITEVGGADTATHTSPTFYGLNADGAECQMRLKFTHSERGMYFVDIQELNSIGSFWSDMSPEYDSITIYYKHLHTYNHADEE